MKHVQFKLPRAAKTALSLLILSAFAGNALADRINLNTADAETMQYIPGIGQSRAEQIIQAREKSGGFTSMDEIDAIPGVGEVTMREVRKHGSLDSGVSELTEEMRRNPPAQVGVLQQNATANTGGS